MRQTICPKEIYFAMTEILPFSVVVNGLQCQLANAFGKNLMRLLDVFWMCE